MAAPLPRRLVAELLGTALLVAVVVGSGITAQQLSPGDVVVPHAATSPEPTPTPAETLDNRSIR